MKNKRLSNPLPGLKTLATGLALGFLMLPLAAQAVLVTVDSKNDPWLAGMPDGATASSGSSVSVNAPVQVTGLDLSLGGILTFTNGTGCLSNTSSCNVSSLDGGAFWDHRDGSENGISGIRSPIAALIGVFLDDTQPNLSAAPAALNYETSGIDFLTASPLLKQVFFIGDGDTTSDVVQQFLIPTGATRLFLGTMDAYGYSNNVGTATIEVTQISATEPASPSAPAPSALALLAIGLGGMSLSKRRRKA